MTKRIIKTTFQLRRGLAATWVKDNPVLAYGEPGFEKDTNKLKIGNGTDAWNDLPYLVDVDSFNLGDNITVDTAEGLIYTTNEAGEQIIIAEAVIPISSDAIQALFD